jgi:hypothetical protein
LDDDTLADLRAILVQYRPPKAIVIYGAEAHLASNSAFAIPDLTFSSNVGSFDIGAKPLFGKRDGFLVAVRHELTRHPLVDRYLKLWSLGERLAVDDRTVTLDQIRGALEDVAKVSNRMAQAGRVGIVASYSNIDDAERGAGGLSLSRAFKTSAPPETQAVFVAASVQADWRYVPSGFVRNLPRAPIERTGLHTSIRVGWQDQLPYIKYNQVCPHDPEHDVCIKTYRWHFKAGMEYSPRNAVNGGDTVALFLRYRDIGGNLEGLSWRQIEDRTTEFGLSVGKGPDDRPFVLLSVSRSIGF